MECESKDNAQIVTHTETSDYLDSQTVTSDNVDSRTETSDNADSHTETSDNVDGRIETSDNADSHIETSDNVDSRTETSDGVDRVTVGSTSVTSTESDEPATKAQKVNNPNMPCFRATCYRYGIYRSIIHIIHPNQGFPNLDPRLLSCIRTWKL